jgi:WD40 repeat protein
VELLEGRRLLSSNNSLIAFTAAVDLQVSPAPMVRRGGILVMRPDGTGIRQLTSFQTFNFDYEEHGLNLPDDHPAISPDGTQIAFTSNRADANNWDLYVMDINGNHVRRLTSSPGFDVEPAWSPDGTKIAWTSARAGDLNIFVMNVDGTNIHQLTTSPLEEIEPAWSPDGTQIAYTTDERTNEKDVFIINADGSNKRQVTFTPGQDHDAVFTPDGLFLLISSDRTGTDAPFGDTLKIRVSDGSVVADLNHSVGGIDPNVSPDGSQFAFFQPDFPVAAPPIHMWIANTDGSGTPRELPGTGILNIHPNWGKLADSDGDGRPDYLENFNTFATESTFLSDERTGDSFGTAVGLADLTHDGFPDLVVGIPGRDVDNHANAGQVAVVRGSPGGPLPIIGNIVTGNPPDLTLTSDVRDMGGALTTNGQFGRSIASGDFNGDGFTDIAIGAPGQRQVFVSTGIGTPWQVLTSNDANFGETLAVADFNGDGFADLAVGAPTALRVSATVTIPTGAVSVFYGSPNGLPTVPQVFDGNDATLKSNAGSGAASGDLFGFSLAAGDVNGDGVADLAVGVPGKTINGVSQAGLVHLIPGVRGQTLRLAQAVARDARSLPSPYTGLQTNARFGEALALVNFDGNAAGRQGLVVGIPRQNIGSVVDAGLVAVFPGAATGLLAATPTALTTADVGGGATLTTSNFGQSFAVGDFSGDGVTDLAIAADRQAANGISEAGQVYLVFGSRGGPVGSFFIPGGLVAGSAQRIDSASVGSGRQVNGHFGASILFPSGNTLAAADIDLDGQADLFIGEPQADVGGVADAGLIGIRYGVKVGTFTLTPPAATIRPGGRLTLGLTWTHPENWQELETLHLRLVGAAGVVAWVRWDQASNTFSLLDPQTGQFGPAGAPGSHLKLRAGAVALELAETAVVGSCPTGHTGTLTLRLRLGPQIPRGEYRIELLATDDHGNAQGFEPAGTLKIIDR